MSDRYAKNKVPEEIKHSNLKIYQPGQYTAGPGQFLKYTYNSLFPVFSSFLLT